MVLGVMGACRADELANLLNEDIIEEHNFVLINIRQTKNKVPRSFVISSAENVNFLGIFRKYVELKKENAFLAKHTRFFMRYNKGKIQNQPVGKNTFYKIPSIVAKFLNLPNPDSYTGHAFRRTSATLLANSGVDILNLKKHGGWKSSVIAESYVADSVYQKQNIASRILNNDCHAVQSNLVAPSVSSEKRQIDVSPININVAEMTSALRHVETTNSIDSNKCATINNYTNCTFNINVNKLN